MLKKLFVICFFASFSIVLNANQEKTNSLFKSFTGKIVGSKVRMRTQPSADAHVVCETRKGQLFAILGEEGDYYMIEPKKEMKGYVFRTFVFDGYVEGDRVNVRLYPDIDAPIVAKINTGDRVEGTVSDVNNKWLEIDLPASSHFYIAKEYIEDVGPVELIATMEKRHREATHLLSAAFLFAQGQIQKSFEQIDFDTINMNFEKLTNNYSDLPDILERVQEAHSVIQDIYAHKKMAFLDNKNQNHPIQLTPTHIDRLAKLGIAIDPIYEENKFKFSEIGETAANTMGVASLSDQEITDKMLAWKPLEDSFFHLWLARNEEQDIESFYNLEEANATILAGIIEPYDRPVKNRPGDYLLRNETLPIAFLYSTKINLDRLVGKRVTLMASPRPNNNFAFPAYHVLSIE
ncbi:MAG: hypothetical protein R3E91_05745 [Chlamydiales bacterium]